MAEETPNPPLPTHDFSIVLVGAMNPRIHHPLWYKHHQLISDAEFEEAINTNLAVTPMLAQFGFSGIQVTCNPDRWAVNCNLPTNRRRILDLAIAVFDGVLPQTPIGVIGFNNDFFRDTNIPDVAAELANGIAARCFRLSQSNLKTGIAFFTIQPPEGGDINFRIEAGRLPQQIIVHVNSNHLPAVNPPPPQPGMGQFEIGHLLRDKFESDFRMARDLTDLIVEGLQRNGV